MQTALTEEQVIDDRLRLIAVRERYGRWSMRGVQRGARGIQLRFSDGALLTRVYSADSVEDSCSCDGGCHPTCQHVRFLDHCRRAAR